MGSGPLRNILILLNSHRKVTKNNKHSEPPTPTPPNFQISGEIFLYVHELNLFDFFPVV